MKTLFLIHFKKDLNYVKRVLKLPERLSKAAGYFGGAGAVERAIYESLTNRLFRLDLRDEDAFLRHAAEKGPSLLQESRTYMDLVEGVIEAYSQTRQAIHGIETANRNNRPPWIFALN